MTQRPAPLSDPRLVLASASPRRRALLEAAGVPFCVRPLDVDESIAPDMAPEQAARELALRKWRAAEAGLATGEVALAADTVVGLSNARGMWELLGKPSGHEDARRMLRALSGTRHTVATGVAVGARGAQAAVGVAVTFVTMRTIEPSEVEDYVESGEWRDKAGGYAIQESADRFVEKLEGAGFDNVVGLPLKLALELALAAGFASAGAALARLRVEGVR